METSKIEEKIGTLSKPSKMPGLAWSIPISRCVLGSILAKKRGTICNSCYAGKGRYVFPNVQKAQMKRYQGLKLRNWASLMVALIREKYKSRRGVDRVFRFFDAGDLQNKSHLKKIVAIAKALPTIRFWLPTREFVLVKEFIAEGNRIPANLIIRVSATRIGQEFPSVLPAGVVSSTVGFGAGYQCPARNQGNQCGPCRACWDPRIKNVDYELH